MAVDASERHASGRCAALSAAWKSPPEATAIVRPDGPEVEITIGNNVVETLGPGEPFGEMALIDQAARTATAIAKTPCKLAVIPEKRFLFMVAQTPHFALQIMKVMADRLRKMNTQV